MADGLAALQAIRGRAGIVAKLGPPRPGGDLINAAHRSAADVPRLLKAVEDALKLADDWDAKAREIAEQITSQDTEGAVAGFKVIGVTRYQEGARALREAITTALAGKDADDGQ
jgi:hypothetical protein